LQFLTYHLDAIQLVYKPKKHPVGLIDEKKSPTPVVATPPATKEVPNISALADAPLDANKTIQVKP
jgi:hypothetical protein